MNIDIMKRFLSENRVKEYEKIIAVKNLADEKLEKLYKLDLQICKELYGFINLIEICMRNSMHNKLSTIHKTENWFYNIELGEREQEKLDSALEQVNREHKESNLICDECVCELNFGFWLHLLDDPYEQSLWINGLDGIFPGHTNKKPNRNKVRRNLRVIHRLRNRIAHCEIAIKDEGKLSEEYKTCKSMLSWLAPEVCDWAKSFNRFEELYDKLVGNDF